MSDLISRDAVTDTIIWYENGGMIGTKELLELIRRLPSVLQEREPCEDAVSRQAVLDYIRDNYRRWFINDDAFMQCVNGIKDFISVTPKQRTGKWIYHTIGFHKCSCCSSLWSTDITKNTFCNYCPRCGAKMEGESE